MVEVRPGSKWLGMRASAGLLAGLMLVGCASPEGLDFGADRARHRELMAAQRARRDLGRETMASATPQQKVSEGDSLRSAGNAQRALFRYLEAHRLDPTNPTARERIAYIHLEEGDPDRARAIFEDVLDEKPTSVNAHLGLGLAQLALGRLELARESLERARSLNPDSAEVLSALGSVYDRMGLHQQARAELDRARTLRPHDPRVLNNLGIAHLLAGDEDAAEAALRESVLLDPRDPAARNNLGLVLGLQGKYLDALAAFREAGPEQAAQNNLGYCYFLNEDYSRAIHHYEQALMAEGDEDLTILHNLAKARAAERQGPRRPRAQQQPTPLARIPEPATAPNQDVAPAEPTRPSAETAVAPAQPEPALAEPVRAPEPTPVAETLSPAGSTEEPAEAPQAAETAEAASQSQRVEPDPPLATETSEPAPGPREVVETATPEPTGPTGDADATAVEPIVLVSEVIDATPLAPEAAEKPGAEAAPEHDAPVESESPGDPETTAKPGEEPSEQAVSDAAAETSPEEPAAPAP